MPAGADCPAFQDLARTRGRAATRGWASSRSTSARVATRTCSRVLVRDTFVFSMANIVTNGLPESVPSVTPVPGLTCNHLLLTGEVEHWTAVKGGHRGRGAEVHGF